jgi:hypothetical protein
MVDPVEAAHEQLEEANERTGEAAHGDRDPWPRRMAVVVSCLAVSLALADLGAKSSQTAYLTEHIDASDTWNAYQAKNLRATLWSSQVEVLRSLPDADGPAIQDRIKEAVAEAGRMHDEPSSGDGMKQLQAKAHEAERERDHAFHTYHGYEHTAGALEICIVLASVSVVTRIRTLGLVAASIGAVASLYGLWVYAQLG